MLKRILSLTVVFLSVSIFCFALIPIPVRIGGTVTVNGVILTQATATNYIFSITRTDGASLSPSAESNGLSSSNYYVINIPIYNASEQAGGATPGETLVIHVYENGTELYVASPSNGQFTCGDSGSIAQMNIIAHTAQQPVAPVADAGEDQRVDEGDIVALDGSNSSDADGTIISYSWTQTSGIPVTLSATTEAKPVFTSPEVDSDEEILTFQLTVTDNNGLQSSDECSIFIENNEGGGSGCFIISLF